MGERIMTIKFPMLLASLILFLISINSAAAYQKGVCPDPAVTSNWFPHSQTPEPDNANFKSSSICNFHEWSWQMFLWLTQDVGGEPRFLTFDTPYSLIGVTIKGELTPHINKGQKIESFHEYLQAGSDGILVDQNGNPVYYSQYINDTYIDFIKDNNLTDPNKVRQFNPDTPFPIGTIELKAAWRKVESGEDTSNVFTKKLSVYSLVNKDGKIVVNTDKPRMETLALVGFHIGGVVKGHPEMIWASFEHNDNAPNVPEGSIPSNVISKKDFTFYRAGSTYAECNVNYANSPLRTLDEATQKLLPIVEVCRQYEFGNSAKNDPVLQDSVVQNDKDIADLNQFVMPQLAKENDVWANYREVGAIWFKPVDALRPSMSLASDFDGNGEQFLIGSLKFSNSTLETFTQTASAVNNCFRCHNTQQRFSPGGNPDYISLPPMNLNISRAFVNIYFWSQELLTEAKK